MFSGQDLWCRVKVARLRVEPDFSSWSTSRNNLLVRETVSAVKQVWHIYDSQGQVLALVFGEIWLKYFKVLLHRLEAVSKTIGWRRALSQSRPDYVPDFQF